MVRSREIKPMPGSETGLARRAGSWGVTGCKVRTRLTDVDLVRTFGNGILDGRGSTLVLERVGSVKWVCNQREILMA